jgi:hypothetical protein
MSKAIDGAIILGVAGAMFLAMDFATGGLGALANTPLFFDLMLAVAGGGVSMEGGAIAEALTSNRGMNISTRTAAGLRQIIYGQQRVGGTIVYKSTTGAGGSGGNYVMNYIIPVATHTIDSYINIYLDGRQLFFAQNGNSANIGCGHVSTPPTTVVTTSGGVVTGITATGGSGFSNVKATRYRVFISGGGGSGAEAWATNAGAGGYGTTFVPGAWTVTMVTGGSGYTSTPQADLQGKYVFGGSAAADEQDPTQVNYGLGYGIGPGGVHYNFANKAFCEVRFGDQPAGDYMASLTANDSQYPTTARGGGIAYLYLNVGYDTTQFPGEPEIRVTVNGKNTIWDPRTSTYGFSTNWALQVADVITDPIFGLGDPSVNQAQLIVCDQMVLTSQGNEFNFSQHIHYDTSTSPGDALAMMMPAAAGKLTRVGGQWNIVPAYWQGVSFAFDESTLTDAISWSPNRSFKDLVNCVNGTYTAPNYPYALTGDLYDKAGWYYGVTNNLWPYAWQPTSFPQYAADVLHGYSSNQFLAEDGGIMLPMELTLRAVISVVQAQRVAKINMMRNRQQGTGTFPMSLAAWQAQPIDVMNFTMGAMGWSGKYLEFDKIKMVAEPVKGAGGEDGALALSCSVSVQETDPSVYEWSITEELTPEDITSMAMQMPNTPAPPSSMTVTSSAGTALIGADGNVTPRALVSWTAPADNTVTQIQVQYQAVGATTWLSAGIVDVSLFQTFVTGVVAGSAYNFQIRSLRPSGTFSTWVTASDTMSITLSISATSGVIVAPSGTLTTAVTGATADIVVAPFTATVGSLSVACLTAGAVTIPSLVQSTLYYVYYTDVTFSGGAITPVATIHTSDFLGKLGYFLIGSITTA